MAGMIFVYPLSVGYPLPPYDSDPQAVMLPSAFSAAKEYLFAKIFVYPLSVGAPLPPLVSCPQAVMLPSAFSAVRRFACIHCLSELHCRRVRHSPKP